MNIAGSKESHKIIIMLVFLLAWNSGFSLLDLPASIWFAILLVDFVVIVGLLQKASLFISPQKMSLFEKSVAVAFPFMLMGAWERDIGITSLVLASFPSTAQDYRGHLETLNQL